MCYLQGITWTGYAHVRRYTMGMHGHLLKKVGHSTGLNAQIHGYSPFPRVWWVRAQGIKVWQPAPGHANYQLH